MAEPWEISWGNLHVIPTTVLVLSIMLLGLVTFSLVLIIFQLVILMEFSHHCCLSFVMRVNISGRLEDDIELTHHPKSFVWDPSMSNCLRDVISSHEVQNKLISFLYVCMVKTIYLFSWWKHHVNLLLQSFRSVSSDLHQF